MISHENKAIAFTLTSLLVVLTCAKVVFWPWLVRRRTHRYRRMLR